MLDSRSKKLVSLLFAVVILLSCVVVYQFVEPEEVKGEEHQVLGLSVSPFGGTFKLGVNQTKTFTASALNGTGPYDFSWFIYPSEDSDFYLTVNGEKCHVNDYINYMKIDGESLTLCFPEATEDFVSIVLSGVDANGLQGHSESFIVADPYTSSGYYFDGSQAVYSYKVSSDGLGWYRVFRGSDGSAQTSYDGTNSTTVVETLLGDMTSGALFLDGVAFDLDSLSVIPEDVRVICLFEDEYFEYINSADSSGSPYTVSVGSGVNVGYYLAQDGEGRICYSSTNASELITQTLVMANVYKGEVFVKNGVYTLTTPIIFPTGNLRGLTLRGESMFWTQIQGHLLSDYAIQIGNGVDATYNVFIKNLAVNGGIKAHNCAGINIYECYVVNSWSNGYNIVFDQIIGGKIIDSHIKTGDIGGIYITEECTHLEIGGCDIEANYDYQIFIEGTVTGHPVGVYIHDTWFEAVTGVEAYGIYAHFVEDLKIVDNHFVKTMNNSYPAIVLTGAGGSSYTTRSFVSGNWILGTTDEYIGDGIYLDHCRYSIIQGNNINTHANVYPINMTSNVYATQIKDNVLTRTGSILTINVAGTENKINGNIGFVTENSFSGSNSTSTTAVLAHGCAGQPDYVYCSFNDTAITGYSWSANATYVTVTIAGSPTGNFTTYVEAKYIP